MFLHWSWFVVALIEIQDRAARYTGLTWNVLEYLALFLIVLMHEFGHALACRQVGGKADQIVLWPLGGVAYVAPPQRPGATLWSIAAGPLVNVALIPVLTILVVLTGGFHFRQPLSDAHQLIQSVWMVNLVLLLFNLLPVYPLDGGQILRSVLWFVIGRVGSLMVATMLGFAGVILLVGLAVLARSFWIGIMAVFILLNCWRGLIQARLLAKAARMPRRDGFACPVCRERPVLGRFWMCPRCRAPFDTFETQATCPGCGTSFSETQCLDCGEARPFADWADPIGSRV